MELSLYHHHREHKEFFFWELIFFAHGFSTHEAAYITELNFSQNLRHFDFLRVLENDARWGKKWISFVLKRQMHRTWRFTLFACRANDGNLGLLLHHTPRSLFLRIRFQPLPPCAGRYTTCIISSLYRLLTVFLAAHSICVFFFSCSNNEVVE